MAFSRNPSYLKRQKEQQRAAKAAQKREARLARKHAKASGAPEEFEPLDGPSPGPDLEGDEATPDEATPGDGSEATG